MARAMLRSMSEVRRFACHRIGSVLASLTIGACGGAAATQPADRGALEALDGGRQRVAPHGDPATAFESKPAAARTLPSLENPLRARLVQGYQRAGAASGITVVPDERLDRAMDDLARSLDDGEDPRSETVEFLLGFHGLI